MNELKILGVDANVYFKNIEYYIKNPRKTHFRIFKNTVKLQKDEYVDINSTMGKEFMDKTLLAFTNATRVVINDNIAATHIMQRNHGSKNLSENLDINDFKPMLDNYILMLPWPGNLFHIHGYWITKQKDSNGQRNHRVMSFVVHNNKLNFFRFLVTHKRRVCLGSLSYFEYSKREAYVLQATYLLGVVQCVLTPNTGWFFLFSSPFVNS